MKVMTRGRKCRTREARTAGEAAEVDGEEYAWAFREWAEVRTVDAEAEAETRATKTANKCRRC
jgi:hypothetical protein